MFKKPLVTLFVLGGLFAGGGMALPNEWTAEKTVRMGVERDKVFGYIALLRSWPDWTAWSREADSSCKWTFEGPQLGVGAIMRWNGEVNGSGRIRIDQADEETGIDYTLEVDGQPPTKGKIRFSEAGTMTAVTWSRVGEVKRDPLSKWLGLLVPYTVGNQLERSLLELKDTVEKGG